MTTTKEYIKESFLRIYKELTDDELIKENKKKHDRKKEQEDRKIDTGL